MKANNLVFSDLCNQLKIPCRVNHYSLLLNENSLFSHILKEGTFLDTFIKKVSSFKNVGQYPNNSVGSLARIDGFDDWMEKNKYLISRLVLLDYSINMSKAPCVDFFIFDDDILEDIREIVYEEFKPTVIFNIFKIHDCSPKNRIND